MEGYMTGVAWVVAWVSGFVLGHELVSPRDSSTALLAAAVMVLAWVVCYLLVRLHE